MNKKIIRFGKSEIEKHKFHQHKISILINDTNIDKILISNKVSFNKKRFKRFIGYKDDKKSYIYMCNTCRNDRI